MARTKAISLLQAVGANADLAEIYGLVIEGVRKETLAGALKSDLYTGNPIVGSVEFKRFVNAVSQNYGTARLAHKGAAVVAPPVTVNLDQKKEIVEEVAKFDLDTFGVGNLMARRAINHIDTLASDLDTAFFAAAHEAATKVSGITGENVSAELETFIQMLETVKNSYVTGVPRHLMAIVGTPAFYGSIRSYLDVLPAGNVDSAAEEFGLFHGVRVYSSIYLPEETDALLLIRGALAQPVVTYPYTEPEKIQLSNDYAVQLFYNYGVKALTPDLIFSIAESELGSLTVTSSKIAEDTTNTKISVAEQVKAGRMFVYKTHSSTAPTVTFDADLTDWTALPVTGVIAATNGHKITVAEVTSEGKARRSGNATIQVGA